MSPQTSFRLLFALFLFVLVGACTTIPVDERNQIRDEVNQVAESTIAQMIENDPTIRESLDKAVGYAVASVSATKIPVLGGGYGLALLHEQQVSLLSDWRASQLTGDTTKESQYLNALQYSVNAIASGLRTTG